jgi:hypothetical protein
MEEKRIAHTAKIIDLGSFHIHMVGQEEVELGRMTIVHMVRAESVLIARRLDRMCSFVRT